MHKLRNIKLVLICLFATPGVAQDLTTTSPEYVEAGQMFWVDTDDVEQGDVVRWKLYHPRGIGINVKEANNGATLFVDPPIGFVGTIELECQLVNFDKRRWHETLIMVTVRGPIPPPKPEPDIDPVDPLPRPDVDVEDTMGVGRVAFEAAPSDPKTATAIADIYRRSAEFLYGRPKAKFIAGPDHPRANDPEYNLLLWQKNQVSAAIGANAAWKLWTENVADAFLKSQMTNERGFLREDWYAAFLEVASALEKVN